MVRAIIHKQWQRVAVLSLGHGLNDFAAGYMLGNMLYLDNSMKNIAVGFLVYNLLAFGGQYFAALLIRKTQNLKWLITASTMANVLGVFLFRFNPQFALVLAGCASAVYHVAGGSVCSGDKAAPLGWFAAPGILGLAFAGYLSYLRIDVWTLLSGVCILFTIVIRLTSFPQNKEERRKERETAVIDRHDLFMIGLLGVISLRSAVWNIFQILHEHNYTWLLAIAFSAFAGKILGGWISDKIGWRLYSFASLLTAMPLLSFFRNELVLFCLGIGLLQSAIPANTAMMIQYGRKGKEEAIAFSFGTAVFIGMLFTALIRMVNAGIVIDCFLFALFLLSAFFLVKKRLKTSLL